MDFKIGDKIQQIGRPNITFIIKGFDADWGDCIYAVSEYLEILDLPKNLIKILNTVEIVRKRFNMDLLEFVMSVICIVMAVVVLLNLGNY